MIKDTLFSGSWFGVYCIILHDLFSHPLLFGIAHYLYALFFVLVQDQQTYNTIKV